MSSNKHELSRQQGVVTPPRPLVQSARLLPARLGTAQWRMEGQRSCGSGEEVSMNQWQAERCQGWKVKLGDRAAESKGKKGRKMKLRGRCKREKGKEEEEWLFSCWFWMQKWPLTPQACRWGRSRPSPWINIWTWFILSIWVQYTDAGNSVGVHVPNPLWGNSFLLVVVYKSALQLKRLGDLLFTRENMFFSLSQTCINS